ncbi:hypothetical protein AB4343_10020 [Vibrio breoganii]|uniref:hypothetical protein n=1 Tax=Vibrio breoganii TaxID=553239 RepID=UPI000C85722B|nr:hypothetical protein [Vibrio breoganii]PMF81321.1 hypothetical protein BCV08_15620 [Vibrio breoganii]PMG94525.1 hypothetical protein BCU79_11780 [Vibrio breoganii]PMH19805.1 hypothetical protein BCU74_05595 [Vibrio breoganii]PMI20529.1 hypothetical protein BCU49_06380 [Vibrio breoganii]PMJ45268.1 hypothetical protein BCU21_14060 [Vibrio breoganii]
MIGNKLVVAFGLFFLPASVSYAEEIDVSNIRIADSHTLSTLRGGFKLSNDYVIDIGISITAAVNGKNIYQNTIANLVFRNGTLTAESVPSGDNNLPETPNLVSVVQVGEGNIIESTSNHSDPSEPTKPDLTTGPSIINIIQNTLDNSVLGLSTVVDVDARVESVNKQIRDDLRLKESLLQHRY